MEEVGVSKHLKSSSGFFKIQLRVPSFLVFLRDFTGGAFLTPLDRFASQQGTVNNTF